jgi:hypothetical protein
LIINPLKTWNSSSINRNSIHTEIKNRYSGNACYYSLQSLLFFLLLSENLKIKTYKTIVLPVVLYECVSWDVTLRRGHRLRMFGNKVLRIFGPKREEIAGG